MKIIEERLPFGTRFIVVIKPGEDWLNIGTWLKQNDISFIFEHQSVYEDHFFIRDEAGIMAFKLRWIE